MSWLNAVGTPRWRGCWAARLLAIIGLALLAGCAAKRPPERPTSQPAPVAGKPVEQGGGLYAPHIKDGIPLGSIDVDTLAEPVPRHDPLARYGNRSPYTVLGRAYHVLPSTEGYRAKGTASWYGSKFHGRPTSSFEPYDVFAFTAAHKTLPLPSYVRVTNLENGRSLVVRVNDRGPFHDDRIIDLSYAAAVRLGVHPKGTAAVEVVGLAGPNRSVLAPAASPAAEVATGGPVRVQVASYRSADAARDAVRLLDASQIEALDIEPTTIAGSRWFRVVVVNVAAAEVAGLLDRLGALGFPDARLQRPARP